MTGYPIDDSDNREIDPEDRVTVSFSVNGVHHRVTACRSMSLLEVLRNRLGLTGAKKGCDTGQCGACTVIIDGRSVKSCRFPAVEAEGRTILTIEGLASQNGELHPLQTAFLEVGAVQCGFCSPGMIMSAWALLLHTPQPSRSQIRNALQNNICRCTGYKSIEDAVLLASRHMMSLTQPPSNPAAPCVHSGSTHNPPPNSVSIIGTSPFRIDGKDKVTGRARFTQDIPLNNPLYGAVCWTPIPSGCLLGLELESARAMPGVVRILTADDIPGINRLGRWRPDRPVFVEDRIRFIGDALALVLAESSAAAKEAVNRIGVHATKYPGTFTLDDALRPHSQPVHPDGNIVAEITLRKATEIPVNTREDAVYSSRFQTGFVEHAVMEPEVAAAWMEGTCMVIAAPSQNVFFDRLELMRILGIPPRELHRIRVIASMTGGAFGKHEDLSAQPFAALGTWLTGRPVRIVFTRQESFLTTTKRHPMVFHYTSRIAPDHNLIQQTVTLAADTGAYASWAPNILRKSAVHATGPYRVPELEVQGRSVFTNNAFSGAFRGFGAVQALFAAERHMDIIARTRRIDPVLFRIRNGFVPGDTTATGQILRFITPIPELIQAAADALPWPGSARGTQMTRSHADGVGIAAAFYGIGYGNGIPDKGQVEAIRLPDGRVEIRTSAIDYGQGAATIFAQLAAETLALPLECIDVITGDTERTPDSGSTVASRQTMVTGHAVVSACRKLTRALIENPAPHSPVSVRSRFLMESEHLHPQSGQGDVYRAYATAAAAARVRVNLKTGIVRVLHVVSVHDSGTVIHPTAAQGQVTGGIMMAIGMTLTEDYPVINGYPSNRDFSTYRVPRIKDMPRMDVIFLPTADPIGPFGAKGLGEPAMLAAGPAVLNAVCDALDIDFDCVPVLPNTIIHSLKNTRPFDYSHSNSQIDH
ncbi:molybdopterin-dependent oxidoreductase [bacterium]|nr:molybdopterin-dependent oxidoreductase [candidate division CSSED10-310 bacterium]